jgi:TetR/AcrR family transcriptional repressor of mexJK operon
MSDALAGDAPAAPSIPARAAERGRGRPPVDSRENRLNMLFDGAHALLSAGEYGAFTIEAVANSAGMARKTVYTLVASKEELINGLILREGAKLDRLLSGEAACPSALLAELRSYLSMWARLALGPAGLGMYLLAVAQRESSPAIARSYELQGVSYAVQVLREWLGTPAVNQVFAIDDVEQALNLVGALLIAQPLRTAALGLTRQMSEQDIDTIVDAVIAMFVRCYAAPSAAWSGSSSSSSVQALGVSPPKNSEP